MKKHTERQGLCHGDCVSLFAGNLCAVTGIAEGDFPATAQRTPAALPASPKPQGAFWRIYIRTFIRTSPFSSIFGRKRKTPESRFRCFLAQWEGFSTHGRNMPLACCSQARPRWGPALGVRLQIPQMPKEKPRLTAGPFFWRSGRDLNPRAAFDGNTISSRARYDHFDTTAYAILLRNSRCYYTKSTPLVKHLSPFFKRKFLCAAKVFYPCISVPGHSIIEPLGREGQGGFAYDGRKTGQHPF